MEGDGFHTRRNWCARATPALVADNASQQALRVEAAERPAHGAVPYHEKAIGHSSLRPTAKPTAISA